MQEQTIGLSRQVKILMLQLGKHFKELNQEAGKLGSELVIVPIANMDFQSLAYDALACEKIAHEIFGTPCEKPVPTGCSTHLWRSEKRITHKTNASTDNI